MVHCLMVMFSRILVNICETECTCTYMYNHVFAHAQLFGVKHKCVISVAIVL